MLGYKVPRSHLFPLFFMISAPVLFLGCSESKHSGAGFRLPDGDVEKGRLAFVELNCVRCHSVVGEDALSSSVTEREIHVVLGGDVTRDKTYGQLVTSIINPSHVISAENRKKYVDENGASLMPDMTDELTARQVIDLVTFLQTKYKVKLPPVAYEDMYLAP